MPLNMRQARTVLSSFLFSGLDGDALTGFLCGLDAAPFPAGASIYTADHFQKSLGVITRGDVLVLKPGGVVLNSLCPGECFGVAALFRPVTEYVTTVQAKTAAEVVFITGEQLTALFQAFPQSAINYISFLAGRIEFLNRKIDSFTAPNTAAGLAFYLLESERGGAVTVSTGYADLARRLNMGRASLYRSLDALERDGMIRRDEHVVFILDHDRLAGIRGAAPHAAQGGV